MNTLLSKDGGDSNDTFARMYRNAWQNLVSDIEAFLQQKFYVNSKLLSRDTSEFKESINVNSGLAGVRIQFNLPRYAKIHIIAVVVQSEQAYTSPEVTFQVYNDNEDGELLAEFNGPIQDGITTIDADLEFDQEALFIAYDPSQAEFRGTQNKFFNSGSPIWNKFECMFPCFGGYGSVKQINGGGLSVIYNVICSVEKFVCENINLFRKAFQWRIGLEYAAERRIGNQLNQFTTMTDERKTELFNFYNTEYQKALENSLKSQNIHEDPYCFQCKSIAGVKTLLP